MLGRARGSLGALFVALVVLFAPGGAFADDDYWQCVPFARLVSGIQIFGDAWTWWSQAAGRYQTGFVPKAGAVLCFRPTGRMRLGHVAVVSQVLTDRVIQITHANWSLIDGERGKIEQNVTVVDVSPSGDWSQVKVWYDPLRDLGTTTYFTYGFIYKTTAENAGSAARNAALSVAQTSFGQMAAAVTPQSQTPVQAFAKDSTDKIAALIQSVIGGGSENASR